MYNIGLCVIDKDDKILKTVKLKSSWLAKEAHEEMKIAYPSFKEAVASTLLESIQSSLDINDIKELLEDW